MRNKNYIIKDILPPPLPFPALHSQFSLSLAPAERGWGIGTVQFHRLSAAPSSSHFSSASAQAISTGSSPSGTE